MELIPNKAWNVRRRGYNKLSSSSKGKRNIKTLRFGSSSDGNKKRLPPWRIRIVPKLRVAASPAKLWRRFKNAYVKMMLKFANKVGTSNSANMFGERRIPKARDDHLDMSYTTTEFENRLILEIYKSMVSSLELGNYNR